MWRDCSSRTEPFSRVTGFQPETVRKVLYWETLILSTLTDCGWNGWSQQNSTLLTQPLSPPQSCLYRVWHGTDKKCEVVSTAGVMPISPCAPTSRRAARCIKLYGDDWQRFRRSYMCSCATILHFDAWQLWKSEEAWGHYIFLVNFVSYLGIIFNYLLLKD